MKIQTKTSAMKNLLLFVIVGLFYGTTLAQHQADKKAIAQVMERFQQGIMEKDSAMLQALFFDKTTPVIGVMSVPTEQSIQRENPDFQGLTVSNSSRFIKEICTSKKKQAENFAKAKISLSERIATVTFLYSFVAGGKVLQWGQENWAMVFAENQWLITSITFTIKHPNIEELPKVLTRNTASR